MVQKTVVPGGSDEEMAAEAATMISERFVKLPNGEIIRKQDMQMELAEWVEVSENCWERQTRRW